MLKFIFCSFLLLSSCKNSSHENKRTQNAPMSENAKQEQGSTEDNDSNTPQKPTTKPETTPTDSSNPTPPIDTALTHPTKFGIFYHTWHCHAAQKDPVKDITKILSGNGTWGDLGEPHWWGEPQGGYYCLTQNEALIKKHAEQLKELGVDFVFVDVTNHQYADGRSDRTADMILEPLDKLLPIWSKIKNAPKIVYWVPAKESIINSKINTIDALIERMAQYPELSFFYQGKPLIILTENDMYPVNVEREKILQNSFTVRRMWAFMPRDSDKWSYLERCKKNPTSWQACDQRISIKNGQFEQLTVSTAYGETFMSIPTATSKNKGTTFRKQFETLLLNPKIPITLMIGWNEWIVGRTRCDWHVTCPCSKYPQGCFTDQYTVELNRDIEPNKTSEGDFYFRLVKSCIQLYKSGEKCSNQNKDHLCCLKN